MEGFDIVSLGYNCYPGMYSDKKNGANLQFFSNIAVPSWALVKMLENNFSAFNDKNDYVPMKIFSDSGIHFLTNKTYYARLAKGTIVNDDFLKKLNERKTAFIDILKSDKEVLFLRYEEPEKSDLPHFTGSRIVPNEYAEDYKQNEIYHLKLLSTYLQKTYPGLKYHIMFVGNSLNSETKLDYDAESKIITIPNANIGSNYEKVFDDIFANNATFIKEKIGK
uniref:Papain-like cysteine peptidase n=1 Tax=viral metagenome TaxID=1070528 RepID=A0A6C0C6R9_9ZZZZ